MKKLFLIISICMFSLGSYAQRHHPNPQPSNEHDGRRDHKERMHHGRRMHAWHPIFRHHHWHIHSIRRHHHMNHHRR